MSVKKIKNIQIVYVKQLTQGPFDRD